LHGPVRKYLGKPVFPIWDCSFVPLPTPETSLAFRTNFSPVTKVGQQEFKCKFGTLVRHDDEWDWLRTTLSTPTLRKLLGKDDAGRPIERSEMRNIRALHFLLLDHLDRGFNATSGYDSLGKNLCEYIRSKQ
jgi:hypothetical protein